MTSRYVRPDVKAQHHDYEDPDCPFHVSNLRIIWEPLFFVRRSWLSECNRDVSPNYRDEWVLQTQIF
jgi:hypothetical protein